MHFSGDTDRGAWIVPRMSGWATRDAVLPGGFAGYARIFHPGVRYWWEGPVNQAGSIRLSHQLIRWTEAAHLTRSRAHPWMQWGGIARVQMQEADLGDGTSLDPPEDGRLPRHILEALLPVLTTATATPDDVTAAVWEGWGDLHTVAYVTVSADGCSASGRQAGAALGVTTEVTRALERGPLLQLPGRNHLLLTGALSDLANPDWAAVAGLGRGVGDGGVAAPQLLWPEDHAWCLATEIDFGFSLLGGSVDLIDEVLNLPGVEVAELDRDGDLRWDGDTINPVALDRT